MTLSLNISRLLHRSLPALAALSLSALVLTGCGIGAMDTSTTGPTSLSVPSMSGVVHGGFAPVANSTVTLWETDPTNAGYPSASVEKAVSLSSTTSNASGSWTLTTTYKCTLGNYIYITATGGTVSGYGTSNAVTNPNLVMMAALGPCSSFPNVTAGTAANVHVVINEVSTVAAAYALGNFIYVDNGSTTGGVYIGAPAANNASSPTCTSGASMTCTANGLGHAFTNAIALTDSVHFDSTTPTGLANTVLAKNSLGSIPQAEIHALANILQYCTNNAGGTAPSGTTDGTNCGNLFAATPSLSGVYPTDTLTAAINIAHAPTSNVGTLYNFIPANNLFNPTLAQVPADFALAITYTGLSDGTSWGAASGTTYYPISLALDAADNVYVLAGNGATSATSTASTLSGISNAGAKLWTNASFTNPASATAIGGCYPGTVATDTNGNVWASFAPSSGKSCAQSIQAVTTSAGALSYQFTSAAPYSVQGQGTPIAFDRYNNLWYARTTSSGTNVGFRFPYAGANAAYQNTSTVAADVILNGSSGSPAGVMANSYNIVIDSKGNVYDASYSSSVTGAVYTIPNLTPSGTPTYTGQAASGTAATGTASYLTTTLQTNHSGALGIDGSGNVYAGAASGEFSKITPTVTSGVITAMPASNITVAPATGSAASTPYAGQIDSNGTFLYPSFTASGGIWAAPAVTSSSTVTANVFFTCYAPAGATVCSNLTYSAATPPVPGAPSSSTAGPHMLQIDSSGDAWIPAETAGNLIEVIGSAGPLWPQLSYGVFATKPQ